ncbi:DUF4406 domain-containing protein [Christensenella minuta]|uniref:DUF7768 domain-containing protein n=1 Tax=Christensenella minuta TaxID=626937 RepID=UPI002805D97A|nr:DUF4406 domain-containing protein [Christensenella minuta]
MNDVSIKHVSAEEIKEMTDTEGLIFQGCGGDPAEWVSGISDLLTKEGILLGGDSFKEVYVFEHDGRTNILFNMENVKLDMGKLAMWRLKSHSAFGGYWLSDYLPNRLGIDADAMQTVSGKPEMQLAGMDGNIFNVLGNASRLLKENGLEAQTKEMFERVTASKSYEKALEIVSEYVQTELSIPEKIQEIAYDSRGFERLYKTILRDESMPKTTLEHTLHGWYCAAWRGDGGALGLEDFVHRLKTSNEKPYASLAQTCRSLHFLRQELYDLAHDETHWNEYYQVNELYDTCAREYQERFQVHVTSSFSSWKLCEASLYPKTEIQRELDHGHITRQDNAGPKHIYICAPLRNDVERNVETARLFAKEVFDAGDIPICPHLMFPPIADPKDTVQDEKAFGMCLKLIEGCQQINVYGRPTEGMEAEITHAKRLEIPVYEVPSAKKRVQEKPPRSRNPGR